MERKNDVRISAPDPTHSNQEVRHGMPTDTARHQAQARLHFRLSRWRTQKASRPISRRGRRYATAGLILALIGGLIMPVQGLGWRSETVSAGFLPTGYAIPKGMEVTVFAKRFYLSQGATLKQWTCLHVLWTRESHWNYKARNPHGGAYGIPQAYPASKLASAGKDWRTNPATQIRWGLKYIKHRYNNNACYALKHSFKRGWY